MEGVRSLLGGRYRLEDVIGRGGMSTVYRANDEVLGRTVAIKVLAPALAESDPVWVARFEREARAAASLTHPGIATIYDTGIEDGTRFIVMECVRGHSLATILHEEAPLDPARATDIAAQVADVLAAAHAAGIVHRDIKPGNVMIAPDGSVKVLDFGIARALDGTALTQTVSVLGTAAYMPPEQAAGQPADARSDIYSLGCVLYAMLAGAPPFAGELPAAMLHQHVNAEPPSLRSRGVAVPAALEALVGQMLAKPVDARPQSAAEVRDRLRAAFEATAPTVLAPLPARIHRTRPVGLGSGWLLTAAAALLVIAVVAIALATGGSSTKRPPRVPKGNPTPSTTGAPTTTARSTTTTPPQPPATSKAAPPAPPGNGHKHKGKGKPPGKAKGHDKGGGGGDSGD